MSEFIFMLTYNDETIANCLDVYEEVKHTGVKFVGFKDVGVPESTLKELVNRIRANGHYSFLEVVSLKEEDELRSAESALRLGVDYLIGGTRVPQVLSMVRGTGVKYFPYVGEVIGHPAKLGGNVADIVAQATAAEALGVDGINLLSYRYLGDALELTRAVKAAIRIPLLCAGAVDSVDKVQKLSDIGVWAFTIGGAVVTKKMVPTGSLVDQMTATLKAAGSLAGA